MKPQMETRRFADDGETPNHPDFPLVIMRRTPAAEAGNPAAWFERRFPAHGWSACWRWGVYPFHHFHSNNHEVLGVSRGHATLMFGGRKGEKFDVAVGDVIVIPAGVSHKCVEASDNFQVVGAYPDGVEPDIIRCGDSQDLAAARRRVADVPAPSRDPVHGEDGPLLECWNLQTS